MPRVLVLSDLWPPFPGGAERLAFNLARYLAQQGMEVRALTGYEHACQFDGPPVYVAPIGIRDHHAQGWQLIQGYLDTWQPHVLLTHHLYAYEFHAELAATGIPVLQVVLNGHRLPEAAMAVYISDWVAGQAGDRRPGDLVCTPPAMPDVVADSHGPAIGMIKPIPHKGIGLVYKVAATLHHRPFLVLRGEWQTLEDIRPAANIEFMQPVADIREFWRRVRLVLVPSTSEDAGTVAQEATANGVACISSNVQGLAETNGGGVRLPPDDPGQWVRAIKRLDDPRVYARVVARQAEHLAGLGHADRLAALAAAVAELGGWG